jgi:dienelactone hydrolase
MRRDLTRRACARLAPAFFLFVILLMSACSKDPKPSPLFGAYCFPDGRVITISASEGDTLRFRDLESGRSQRLYPSRSDGSYVSGAAWAAKEPVTLHVRFEPAGSGTRLDWNEADGSSQTAVKIPFREQTATIHSNDVDLFAKLVLPEGSGPFPAVVLVHGSEKDAATLLYDEPNRYAAHGVAVLVFDKRGTGRSGGDYGQDFDQLAGDVLAAVAWVRKQPRIDPERVGLAGYSQGGWVAPLAASRSQGAVKFVLVEYGLAEPPSQEERWEVRNALRDKGFGEEAQRRADALVDATQEIVRNHFESGWDRFDALADNDANAPWIDVLKKRGGLTGSLLKYPHWMIRVYKRRNPHMTASWFYDPLPVLTHLDAPMLWLIAGKDAEAPNEVTIERIQRLHDAGRPVDLVIFPNADHGIRDFEIQNGERVTTRYPPDYFQTEWQWLVRQASGSAAQALGGRSAEDGPGAQKENQQAGR